ncbi:beta-ketoacyl-ACP synthase II [SAR202 cluster bacterium AD-804-J14_MRT_500m]|nr:beta-ketoacyl-ACP synthase II [SAR202 cluster bacterium AD-804-J14_MRT_500m]
MKNRVFITGCGVISPQGLDSESTWKAIKAGVSGIDYISAFDAEGFDVRIAAEVKGFEPTDYLDRKAARRTDRFVQFATAACQEALSQAGLDLTKVDRYRVSVLVGSGIGGIITLSGQYNVLESKGPSRVSPFLIPMMLGDMASAQISMLTGALGPNICLVSSCSSGADAIGTASEMIRRGEMDIVLAGGSEAPICPIANAGFASLRALSRRNQEPQKASRPFDSDRDGFVMGEGSAILVLESHESLVRRNATPLAEVLGYGATSDAFHVTEPAPTGESAATAMKIALTRSGLTGKDIDYINAHGTSTPLNDRQETQAIKRALGDDAYRIPISSTKSMTGHLLGAGGALEAALCVKALEHSLIPPTINLAKPDDDCDLDYTPNTAREARVRVVMSNSFGFGGHNSVLVIAEPDQA